MPTVPSLPVVYCPTRVLGRAPRSNGGAAELVGRQHDGTRTARLRVGRQLRRLSSHRGSTRLPRRASVATPRAVPRPSSSARGRAIDELGVTAAGDESEAELLAANERLVRVAAQLRELSATQTHYA